MLTHGDVGVPGSMWLTFTLVEFVQHKRRRLLSLIRLNRRHFKLYRHSYNQEKEAEAIWGRDIHNVTRVSQLPEWHLGDKKRSSERALAD